MCATARSSASPPPRVKARWPSPSFTDTWRKRHDPVREQPRLWRGSTVLESLMSTDAQPDALDVSFPTQRILAIVGDKWTTVVLYSLSIREHRRFNELQKQIPDISKKMLVQTLRNLERDGLLERIVYQQVPPKTEYRLTDNGRRLREPIAWLCEWGMNNREFIEGIITVRPGRRLFSLGRPISHKTFPSAVLDFQLKKGITGMPTLTTKDGVEIFYKDWGKGQPIVFSHGWPLSADDWDAQMLFFLNHGYRVIAHDRRGHGRSSQTGDRRDMADTGEYLAALTAHFNLKDAIHGGHSTGGGEAE